MTKAILNAKEIKAETLAISKDVKSIGKRIHVHMVNIARHVLTHKDVSLAAHFLNTMFAASKDDAKRGTGILRVDAMRTWFGKFAAVSWAPGTNVSGKLNIRRFKEILGAMAAKDVTPEARAESEELREAVKGATVHPYNQLTRDNSDNWSGLDVLNLVEGVIKRAREKREDALKTEDSELRAKRLESIKNFDVIATLESYLKSSAPAGNA